MRLFPLLLVLQLSLLQMVVAVEEEVYKPVPDKDEQAINPNYRYIDEKFFHDPHHVNGQIRDRWCQERCMRHCFCTYGHSCRRSCIAYCDRGTYHDSSRDPFMHNRSKRSAVDQPEDENPPSIKDLQTGTLPYLADFEFDSRAILRRKVGRPVWNPRATDLNAKKERPHDTRWGKLCQDDGN